MGSALHEISIHCAPGAVLGTVSESETRVEARDKGERREVGRALSAGLKMWTMMFTGGGGTGFVGLSSLLSIIPRHHKASPSTPSSKNQQRDHAYKALTLVFRTQ